MSERAATPVRLAYSAPSLAPMADVPTRDCYNPFPDLNDIAPDGSPSLWPSRAKYSLTLDTQYLPWSVYVPREEITEGLLATLVPARRALVAAHLAAIAGPARFPLPRDPTRDELFGFESNFELAHQRLAATDYKWAVRTYIVAPMYTILEAALAKGRKIPVPLIVDPAGTTLERQWARVVQWIEPARAVDEAISLLVCLALNSNHPWMARESAWVAQEDREVEGFADLYGTIRARFAEDFRVVRAEGDGGQRRRLAEAILQYGKSLLSEGQSPIFPPHPDPLPDNVSGPRRLIRWPQHVERPPGLSSRRLIVDPHLADQINIATGPASLVEVAQQGQALLVREEEGEKSFVRPSEAWALYALFEREDGGSVAPRRMRASANPQLVATAMMGIRAHDSDRLAAPTGVWIGDYTLFLEAMRQQICTGVGLRCPFWDGVSCCRFRLLLGRVWHLARPFRPAWPHWNAPPCLGKITPPPD